MENSKRSGVIFWASIAAAAAGIAAVVVIARLRERVVDETSSYQRLRDVQDVLSDCYSKIREIEDRLPKAAPGLATERGVRVATRKLSTGKTVFDS